MSPLTWWWKSRTCSAGVVVVGAVDGLEDRRDGALEPRGGVGEEHGMVEHALAEFGEHVLQHRRARADEVHPVVAEVAPDQRLRAQRQGIGGCWDCSASSVMWNSVTDFELCTNTCERPHEAPKRTMGAELRVELANWSISARLPRAAVRPRARPAPRPPSPEPTPAPAAAELYTTDAVWVHPPAPVPPRPSNWRPTSSARSRPLRRRPAPVRPGPS